MSDPYGIEWRPAARKELDRLDRPVRARILRKIAALADDPRPHGVVRLTGTSDLWRIRIGDYRVVYTIEDNRLIVTVVRVAPRGAVYRAL
ncbi:type II toxin-antitoxin system RelE/ParE family toxin [Amycolatopsis sp. GM8]|uniref:type II toxin-antitoxin system RelE family toxin n=1 Tax=Amycolatopsis sp. GM8 TaxID=2896530 RepID=UPI001F2E8E74|nr:type II toxin-antitoxin system RelE/ParE family toxin [Amycolatopsis sp. GM8]